MFINNYWTVVIIRESGLLLSNIRSVWRYSFLTLQILKVSTSVQHRLDGLMCFCMAKESLCHPNSKHTKMDIHGFDSPRLYILLKKIPWVPLNLPPLTSIRYPNKMLWFMLEGIFARNILRNTVATSVGLLRHWHGLN